MELRCGIDRNQKRVAAGQPRLHLVDDLICGLGAIGEKWAKMLSDVSLKLYKKAHEYALKRGIIIADTKFEFGLVGDKLILIDEVLTPDSSRFWPEKTYKPGSGQPSFDKQFVRDYLESINWDKHPPVPVLPDEIVRKTSEKYLEAYKYIVGKEL